MEPDWEALVRAGMEQVGPEATLAYFAELHTRYPDSARANFELAGVLDSQGQEGAAIPYYERAISLGGLSRDLHAYGLIQLGSSLRNVGRAEEAVTLLTEAERRFPEQWAGSLFLALALHSAGRAEEALATVMRATLKHGRENSLTRYRRALTEYIDDIRPSF